jgi:hypothetical protein
MGRFRTILPFVHCGSAALFGGWGLWQRSAILSRPFLEGQTLGDSTARFHVWPWPYKFAVVANLPAFLAGLMSAWPVSSMWPKLPESAQLVPSLLCAVILWRWVGSRLDRRWRDRQDSMDRIIALHSGMSRWCVPSTWIHGIYPVRHRGLDGHKPRHMWQHT